MGKCKGKREVEGSIFKLWCIKESLLYMRALRKRSKFTTCSINEVKAAQFHSLMEESWRLWLHGGNSTCWP